MPTEYRSEFNISNEFIYLNTGTHSLVPIKVLHRQKHEMDLFEKNPTEALWQVPERLWDLHQKLAPHFGALAKNFHIRPNVTQALNEFIMGIELTPNAEILTSNHEYGAITNICRWRAERDVLNLRIFDFPPIQDLQQMSAVDLVEFVVSQFSSRTEVLVLSEIFTGHGLRLPISAIAKIAQHKGIKTIIDGAHAPGFIALDLETSHIDFYAGNLHKWWMGPKGTAFSWMKKEKQSWLKPIQAGWVTYDLQEPFLAYGEGDTDSIRSMILGCQNFSTYYALAAGIDFWNQHGVEEIFAYKRRLDDFLYEQAQNHLPMKPVRFSSQELRGPLTSFEIPDKWQNLNAKELMYKILREAGVQIAVTQFDRRLYLRISPAIYNKESEILRALQKLAQLLL